MAVVETARRSGLATTPEAGHQASKPPGELVTEVTVLQKRVNLSEMFIARECERLDRKDHYLSVRFAVAGREAVPGRSPVW
jgi:hypothetical protein